MISQVLKGSWADKVKSNALDAIYQYAEFLGKPIENVKFRVFDNKETYIPTPDMTKAFLYRVTKNVRTRILIAVETSASSGEVWRLTWNDFSPNSCINYYAFSSYEKRYSNIQNLNGKHRSVGSFGPELGN